MTAIKVRLEIISNFYKHSEEDKADKVVEIHFQKKIWRKESPKADNGSDTD